MAISSNQLRSARAHLNLGLKEVSSATNIGVGTISDIEQLKTPNPRAATLDTLRTFYEVSGIEFTDDDGIRPRVEKFRHLSGVEGLRALLDDVYEQASEHGGHLRLWNVHPDYFISWLGEEWYGMHLKRMKALLPTITLQATCKEGETNFIGRSIAEYRWVPKKVFNEQAIYCYSDRIAFINFTEDTAVDVFILYNKDFHSSFSLFFDFVWNEITMIPNVEGYKPSE